MKKFRFAAVIAAFAFVVVLLPAPGAWADNIPLDFPGGPDGTALTAPAQAASPADTAFFTANPDALQVAGQTNTWYENMGGVLWLTFTVVVIGVLIAAT